MTTATNSRFLGVPKALSRKTSKTSQPPPKLPALACNPVDDFLSSDIDVDLELSFASTMSIHSPTTRPKDLTPEIEATGNREYTPMDISPAPQRVLPALVKAGHAERGTYSGRPRSGSNSRLFGRDMSNERGSVFSLPHDAKSSTANGTKRQQRGALPTDWLAPAMSQEHPISQPINVPSSLDDSDTMDVDASFVYAPSTSAPEEHSFSASPTVTSFKNPLLSSPEPVSTATSVSTFKNLFYDTNSPSHGHADTSFDIDEAPAMVDASPLPHFAKKRRSTSPQPTLRPHVVQALADEDTSFDSLPPQSSPVTRRLERMASTSMLRSRPLAPLQETLALNVNKKRPRRPTMSAIVSYGDGPMDRPLSTYSAVEAREPAPAPRPAALGVRRAFSAMLPPSILDASGDANDSFESEGPDMSSPAQAYSKRQHVKTTRKCDDTDDRRPTSNMNSLKQGDAEAPKKVEQREKRPMLPERDTPRTKYLSAAAGLGSFGDNEASGKILPCHRVKEDGLMRINVKTLNALLDGVYSSLVASYQIVDCRFDYEYNGGHIPGAININTTTGVEEYLLGSNVNKPLPSMSGDEIKKTVLIFHCEFSAKRAPTFAKHLRSKDRALNGHVYPRICYPEVYILEGGYCQYYSESATRCVPRGYVQMDDPQYATSRKEDLDHFRKNKFGRTKSYAYGESKLSNLVSVKESKRSSVPTAGSTTLFAKSNATRGRRSGSGSALQVLVEDKSLDHDDETDIGDSPCPPPSKTAQFKNGKKLNRLSRAETYDSARLQMGY